MSTITALGANDSGSTSMGVINTNFTNLNADKIEDDSSHTLTNKTISADDNTITNLEPDNFKTAAKTGLDTSVVTGTKGDNEELAKWNADGDLVSTDVSIETSLTSTSDVKVPTSKAVANYVTTKVSNSKSLFVPVTGGNTISSAYDTAVGDFATNTPVLGEVLYFVFRVPSNFSILTDAKMVMIPDATETIQFDIDVDYGSVGESSTTHSATVSNATAAVTSGVITEVSISSALTSLVAGDYVGIKINSDITQLRVIGLFITYT